MDLKIVWTKRARNNYTKILEYIEKEFGSGPAENYHINVEELLQLLTRFPELGSPQVGQDSLRGIILYRRRTNFYTLGQNTIRIINVVDNRWKRGERASTITWLHNYTATRLHRKITPRETPVE